LIIFSDGWQYGFWGTAESSLARRQPVIQPINDAASAATWSTIGMCKVETFITYVYIIIFIVEYNIEMVKIFSPYYPKKYTVAEHNIILLCDTKLYLEYQDMEITLTGILLRSIPT